MPDGPTFQGMVDDEARKAGVHPLAGSETVYVEYAPVAADGTIWWVYSSTDRDSLTVNEGGSVAARVVEHRVSAWTVVGPDWRPSS